jgi:protoporphyrinogen oxidase
MAVTKFIIVGAGISGLTSALTLLHKCPAADVTILDSANEIGGLLRSVSFDNLNFDYGTHIPQLSSNAELDAILFPEDTCKDWQRLSRLKTANYFAGQMNDDSQFVNLTKATEWFYPALYELLQTDTENQIEDANLDLFCRQRFGSTVADKLLSPLMRKFTGQPLSELSAKAPHYYGLSRLVYGDRNCAINLKKIDAFDEVLAFPSDSEKPRLAQWIYPPRGQGIGSWIQLLSDNIRRLGGKFLLNTKISSLAENDGVTLLHTNNGTLEASHVIWTIPVYLGLHGVKQERPASIAIAIHHFCSQIKPLSEQHYIYCYDANMHSYRITLYNNVQDNDSSAIYRCSVEVILAEGVAVSVDEIKQELVTMGLFTNTEHLCHAGSIDLPFGFPVPKAGDEQKRLAVFEQARLHNPGIMFCGRAKPQVFFMTDVLLDTYHETVSLLTKLD